MLTIRNLHVVAHEKPILRGVDMRVLPGEIHAIMGPNGSGKSTLAYTLMGHPSYETVHSGTPKKKKETILAFNKKDISGLSPDERARRGIFLAFQSPIAIPGVSVGKFLRHIGKKKKGLFDKKKKGFGQKKRAREALTQAVKINKELETLARELAIAPDLLKRDLNENFSGGEKKKIETLQMLFLKPQLALVDEVDTGLDVDALRVVAKGIKKLADTGAGVIIITHYQRILRYVKPDRVHVMLKGRIVKSGTAVLAKKVEEKGYASF